MRRDRDEAMHRVDVVPALGLTMDPVLRQLDPRLDDDRLLEAVQAEVARRWPRPLMDGRPSTPVEVILRMLVVKHWDGWSDAATERGGSDRLVWRPCCRVSAEAVPEETTLSRGAHRIQPAPLHRRLDHVVTRARALNVTRGRKRRSDGTVVAPPRQHPTARTLREDGVRGLGRTLTSARNRRQATPALARARCRDRTRRATRQMQRIMEAARPRGTAAADRLHTASQYLRAIARATGRQAHRVGPLRRTQTAPAAPRVAVA
jgi:IS5 family transposase